MSNKIAITIVLLVFLIFTPTFMMYFNLAGFTEVNTDIVTTITGEDFNIITLQGFTTVLNFLLQLGFFTFSNLTGLHPLWLGVFSLLGLIGLIVGVFFARGGGS